MIWLGVLCVLLAAALVVYVTATERQMRGLSASLAQRSREGQRLRLVFPTAAARELAQEANHLIDEAAEARIGAAEERRVLQENLASFSHDVRTPLAGAQGFLQLYAVADDDVERDECVAAAVERLGAMRVLVDALFEYAKADDGSRELAREPVDVAAVVSDVLAALYPAFAERGWQPEVSLPRPSSCTRLGPRRLAPRTPASSSRSPTLLRILAHWTRAASASASIAAMLRAALAAAASGWPQLAAWPMPWGCACSRPSKAIASS